MVAYRYNDIAFIVMSYIQTGVHTYQRDNERGPGRGIYWTGVSAWFLVGCGWPIVDRLGNEAYEMPVIRKGHWRRQDSTIGHRILAFPSEGLKWTRYHRC